MELKEIFDRIEKLTAQATLHGWYREIDDEIHNIVDSIDSETAREVSERISKRLNDAESLSKDEYILTIVFLHKLSYSSFNLSEKLYMNLLEKIYDNDYHFLINHIFNNEHPFPSEMTNNMIRRVYLSYKRAISEAFKINSVELEIPPADAVLYFAVLLCHKSLNDQNKAMIYFLLSRIDTELPEELYKETMRYIYKLSGVIKAVEEDAASALSTNLDIDEEVKTIADDNEKTLIDVQGVGIDNTQPQVASASNAASQMYAENIQETRIEGSVPDFSTRTENQEAHSHQELPPEPVSAAGLEESKMESHQGESFDYQAQETADIGKSETLFTPGNQSTAPTPPLTAMDTTIPKASASGGPLVQPVTETKSAEPDLTVVEETDKNGINAEEHSSYNVTFSKSLEEILELAERFNRDEEVPEYEGQTQAVKKTKINFRPESDTESDTDRQETADASEKTQFESDSETLERKRKAKKNSRKKGSSEKKWPLRLDENKKKGLIIALPLLIIAAAALFFLNRSGGDGDTVTGTAAVGTEAVGTEAVGTETVGTEAVGTETVGTEAVGTEAVGTEAVGTETAGTETAGTETAGTETAGTETAGTETAGTETAGTETAGTETAGTETAGTETAGTETAGTETAGTESAELPAGEVRLEYRSSDGELFTFIKSDDVIIWEVNEQNSFWNLHIFLSTESVVNDAILKSLGDQSWFSFMPAMRQLNPQKRVFREILEDDRYTIYRK